MHALSARLIALVIIFIGLSGCHVWLSLCPLVLWICYIEGLIPTNEVSGAQVCVHHTGTYWQNVLQALLNLIKWPEIALICMSIGGLTSQWSMPRLAKPLHQSLPKGSAYVVHSDVPQALHLVLKMSSATVLVQYAAALLRHCTNSLWLLIWWWQTQSSLVWNMIFLYGWIWCQQAWTIEYCALCLLL